jgi:hypothetical protein
VWLEVTYQGLAPPLQLFADLDLLGWSTPTIAPPPHEAIDWTQPNEATGERFTLRDYVVEAAVVDPPAGSAARGTWTEAERASHLAGLGRVLDRHPDIEVADPGGLVRPFAGVGARPPTEPGEPSPRTTSATPGAPTSAAAVRIVAPIKPSLAPSAEDALWNLGVTARFANRDRVKVERYRGASYETTVSDLHVEVTVAADRADLVVSVLRDLGLTPTTTAVDVPEPELAPAAETDPSRAVGGGANAAEPTATVGRDVGLACVVALADPRSAGPVDGLIGSLGLTQASVAPATRTEVSTYRGSRSERAVPVIRVEIWVPEPHARLVATHLAEVTKLRVGDSSRLWIEPPPVAAPAAPAGAAPQVDAVVPAPAPPALARRTLRPRRGEPVTAERR